MAQPLPLAPFRQDRKSYLTPVVGDVLFSELRDCTKENVPPYGTPHPDRRKWPNHKLVFVSEGETEREGVMRFHYAADREAQDDYNFAYSKADIGGVKFDSVVRSYVFPRADFLAEDVAAGDLMPDTPAGVFPEEYILTERIERPIGQQELASLYIAEDRTYIRRTTLTQRDYDEAFGGVLLTVQTLHYLTETFEVDGADLTIAALFSDDDSPFWDLQTDGTVREGRQLSSNWYALTTRNVVPRNFALSGRSYSTNIDYSWPAVLALLETDIWNLRAGGSDNYVRPVYAKNAFRGPCYATVTETFHVAVPTTEVPFSFLPLPIAISTPFVQFRDEASLHTAKSFTVSTGFNHPVYRNTGGTFSFDATNEVDWPTKPILASEEVRPLRGGYLKTRVLVHPPNYIIPEPEPEPEPEP